jgi:hypothetical protein
MALTLAGFMGIPPLSMALISLEACWYSFGSFLAMPRSRDSQLKCRGRFLIAIVIYVMAKIWVGFIHVVIKAEYWIMLVLRQDEETDEAYLLNLNAPSLFKQGGRYRVTCEWLRAILLITIIP